MAEENHMNEGPGGSPQVHGISEQKRGTQAGKPTTAEKPNIQRSGTRRAPAAKRVTGGEVLDDAKERLRTLKQDTDDYVRRNPTKAVFTAFGIGFVLGLMRRRH